jgi:uncharacterized Zn finger protein
MLIFKEDINMDHNSSIGCSVTECAFHCKDDNYCTLDKIQVVKNTQKAITVECTDCGSFKKD